MKEGDRSRSPKRRDVRDVKFDDERGNPLARDIPVESKEGGSGRFKELRDQFPRREGESRSHWKSRMMTQGFTPRKAQNK